MKGKLGKSSTRESGIAHTWACIGIRLHILDSAPENGSGTVTISTVFAQWNY